MRILVVEDEPDLLRTIAKALREKGYAVDEATNGSEGLSYAAISRYDAIVLDMMMPVMDGAQFLGSFRKLYSTPILILSARDTVANRVNGLNLGADDYLTKPFAMPELFARLQALIRRSLGTSENITTIRGVTINFGSRLVNVGSRSVDLTAKEFSILEMLVLKKNRVVTRTEIYEHVYDANEDSMSNLVDVHISNIRKKIEEDIIETRRGLGYIISV
ncbi:MAG: DNA-binding response regulator [Planctomycetes bacterium]|nr:DNA-binding response regulator [Planctomycetota bacterium]NBY01291.1 DNA-binding response regulator [Planctomycetota bacterium]